MVVALLPAAAGAACTGNTIVGCPTAVSPGSSDLVLGWQQEQNPHTRVFSLPQILGAGLPASVSTLSASGTASLNNAKFGSGANNILTITPGAASTNSISISQSGTGGIFFGTAIASGAEFYANAGGANGGTYTFSGAQTFPNQYGFLSSINLAGSLTGANYFDLHNLIVNQDTAVNGPSAPQGGVWFNVTGNYGGQPWLQNTAYTSGLQRAANGNLYTETAASCTSNNSGTGPSGTGTGIADGTCSWNYVSTNGTGIRWAGQFSNNIRSQIGTVSPVDQQWGALTTTAQITANQGGTGTGSAQGRGISYALGLQSWCGLGATNLLACVGAEIDVGLVNNLGTGSNPSSYSRYGLNLVSYGQFQATHDTGIRFGASGTATVGFNRLFDVQPGAVVSAAALFQFNPREDGAQAGATYPNPTASLGFDVTGINLSGNQFAGNGGFAATSDGGLASGPLLISSSTSAASMDVPGYRQASVDSVSAGTGCKANEEVFRHDLGDIITINTVNGSGVPLTWTITHPGGTTGAAPSNPVSYVNGGGNCVGLAFNETWTRVSTLGIGTTSAVAINIGNSSSTTTLAGIIKGSAQSFTANGTTSVSLTSVAPAGAHATVQEWLTITDASGTVRYVPAF